MFIFQEVKSKDTIKDQVVVAWSNLVNYTQSYVLSGSFTEKIFKKIADRYKPACKTTSLL